jgi:hypothetical protein
MSQFQQKPSAPEAAQQNQLVSLRNEILSSLPSAMTPEHHLLANQACNCQINKNLLEYFVQAELVKLQHSSNSLSRAESFILEHPVSEVEHKEEEIAVREETVVP